MINNESKELAKESNNEKDLPNLESLNLNEQKEIPNPNQDKDPIVPDQIPKACDNPSGKNVIEPPQSHEHININPSPRKEISPEKNINNINVNACNSPKKINEPVVKKEFDEIKPKVINIKREIKVDDVRSSFMAKDYKVDTKLAGKSSSFDLPVKFKSVDYFKLIDTIKKQIEGAMKELKNNKIDKTLAYSELILYYLNNIEK